MRVNIGCGFDHRDGFVNVDFEDFHRPDVVADVRDLPFRSGSCDAVLALDLLEHMPRADSVPALAEWARVLSPGGSLELQVPDLRGLARMVLTSTGPELDEHLAHLYYGTQAYGGDFHQAGFTDATLVAKLASVGLSTRWITEEAGWLLRARACHRVEPTVTISYAEGFHSLEGDDSNSWIWAAADAVLRLLNPDALPQTVTIAGVLLSHSDLSPFLELRAADQVIFEGRISPGGHRSAADIVLHAGITAIPVVTDAPPIDRGLDPRDLRVGFQNLRCVPQEGRDSWWRRRRGVERTAVGSART